MPVELDRQTGRVATVAHEEDIKQSMRIILETAPVSRYAAELRVRYSRDDVTVLDTTTIEQSDR